MVSFILHALYVPRLKFI